MSTETKPSYYGTIRDDLFPYIPEDAGSILDLGCGEGDTMWRLKLLGYNYVAGVEIDKHSLLVARARALKYANYDIHDFDLGMSQDGDPKWFVQMFDRKFNVVLMADVLEHLFCPSNLLTTLLDVLADDGIIVASIPNMGWIGVLRQLWGQRFPYATQGHFDYGHVRFYCKDDIRNLFETHGYEVLKLESLHMTNPMPVYEENMSLSMEEPPNQVVFNGITKDRFEQMFTYQWVCVAKRKGE